MMALSRTKAETLAKVNFPPYTVRMLTSRHILVAGGGGKARTGIENALEIYEIIMDDGKCRAEPCTRIDTGDRTIMNCTTFHNGKYHVIAVGMEGTCQLYQVKLTVEHCDDFSSNDGNAKVDGSVKRRKKSKNIDDDPMPTTNGQDSNKNSLAVGFKVQPIVCVQTDFSPGDEAFQKIVRISPDISWMVTAGADGSLRVWNYPEMKQTGCIEAHKDEVDDLDISPNGKQMVSVSRDGHSYVWNASSLELDVELEWPSPNGAKYRTRNCRFGVVEGDKNRVCLYTAHVPVVRQKEPLSCYLVKWNSLAYGVAKQRKVGTDVLSSMAICDDGRFIALGTMTGDVDIYIAFSLQKIVHAPGSHNIFVTGLEFVPSVGGDGPLITGNHDASVISISADTHIKILHVSKQATISVVWLFFMFIACLIFAFTTMSYFGF